MNNLVTRPIFRFTQIFRVLLHCTTVTLVACSSGGEEPPGTQPQPQPAPDNTGVASYNDFSATEGSPIDYQFQLALNAFDSTTGEPASITGLITTGTDFPLGHQTYTLDALSCTQPNGPVQAFSFVALFDRSSSIRENDLGDKTLTAARTFIRLMSPADEGIIAAFPKSNQNRPSDPVTFFNSEFTSIQDELLTAVDSVGAPDGRTPLWDSMQLALQPFDSATGNRALLVLSDGQDTDSLIASPATIIPVAQAADVKVYAINLHNNNALQLNSVALATGGSVFSTDDAEQLIAFYGNLGKVLSGQVDTCTISITVRFEPDQGIGEVGYGPVTNANTNLQFSATAPAGDIVVEPEIDLPFQAGGLVGQTTIGTNVFESDILQDDVTATNCLIPQGATLSNSCLEPVWATACNADNPGDCQRGVVQPGGVISAYTNSQWKGCPWIEPFDTYEATVQQGTVFTAWSNNAADSACTYSARGPF